MSTQTHFQYKGYRAQIWATERSTGGWAPHGKATKMVDGRDLIHPTAGNSDRTFSTKAEAEAMAKTTTMKHIDEHES